MRRIVFLLAQHGAVHEIPVYQEGTLQGVDATPLDAHHGVAPGLTACALDVAQGDVHAADIAHEAVDDDDLAVVAVVGLAGEAREAYGHERLYLDACHPHALEEAVLHVPAAHVVVDHSHLYALAGLGYQRVGDQTSQGVVLEDIDVDVDMALGGGYVLQEPGEELIAVAEHLHLIIIKGQREALIDKHVDGGTELIGYLQVALLDEAQHGALGQLVERAPADIALLAAVDAEKDVGYDAKDRYEIDDERPGHSLGWLAIVQQHVDDSCDSYQARQPI